MVNCIYLFFEILEKIVKNFRKIFKTLKNSGKAKLNKVNETYQNRVFGNCFWRGCVQKNTVENLKKVNKIGFQSGHKGKGSGGALDF